MACTARAYAPSCVNVWLPVTSTVEPTVTIVPVEVVPSPHSMTALMELADQAVPWTVASTPL